MCNFLLPCRGQEEIPLWTNSAPGSLGTSSNDIPTLTLYLPGVQDTSHAAIIICPGGGYGGLAPHEGKDYALWLNQQGVICFVLKYRLGSHGYHYPVEFLDVSRALRWVRAHADIYDIATNRVGIMGSSAGGHLASMALTHFDGGEPSSSEIVERQSSRPDLGILCYAVISMEKYVNKGSRDNLLGTNSTAEVARYVSSELQVTTNTPPCFIWSTFEDKVVPMENSLLFAEALRKCQVPFSFHIYELGRHGIGLADKPPFAKAHPWARDCIFWLKARGFIHNDE